MCLKFHQEYYYDFKHLTRKNYVKQLEIYHFCSAGLDVMLLATKEDNGLLLLLVLEFVTRMH